MLVIIGQHLSSVKVKLSPSVQLPKAKIVAGNFRVFDFLCFLLCVLFWLSLFEHVIYAFERKHVFVLAAIY